MVFSGAVFLYAFLPLTLAVYALAPQRGRNAVLLIASLLFYAFGEPVYVFLLLLSSVSDWALSLCIERRRGTRTAKLALAVSVLLNLGLLGFFKYADFFLTTVNGLFGLSLPLTGVRLPLGISFYTFQTMSYTIDVYRGHVRPQRNLATFATFVCLFPQLIAGPIVRYSDIEAELHTRRFCLEDIGTGARRFTVGLGKKVLLANVLGELVSSAGNAAVLGAWLGAVGYLLQIYFDFSGYSDMAIGLGRMFGFTFPENFDYPYLARSVTDFWRRWHQTLGQWFRDYVYIPLGGSRTTLAADGPVARRGVEFCAVGRLFRSAPTDRTALARKTAGPCARCRAACAAAPARDARLRSVPRREPAGLWADAPGHVRRCAAVGRGRAVCPAQLCRRARPRSRRRDAAAEASVEAAGAARGPVLTGLLLLAATAALVDGSFNPFLYFRF